MCMNIADGVPQEFLTTTSESTIRHNHPKEAIIKIFEMPFWSKDSNRTSRGGSSSRPNIVDQHRRNEALRRRQQNPSNPSRQAPFIGNVDNPDTRPRESARWYAPRCRGNPLHNPANPIPHARRLHEVRAD
jgi:hypothetical protein